jgi:hypothetical protein
MKVLVLLIMGVWAVTGAAPQTFAQRMFLDANGDGANTPEDRLRSGGATSIDIWVETDRNRDGSPARIQGLQSRALTINSYEFVLRTEGGPVEWGDYTNLQPGMDLPLGPLKNATDYYVGYWGTMPLPPGRYKLGTLVATVKSGSPRLVFASSSPLWGSARTSFGSSRGGKDGDNTLKFTEDPGRIGNPVQEEPGDWAGSDGLAASGGVSLAATIPATPSTEKFSVVIRPASNRRGNVLFRIRTTTEGALVVRLFDVQGRLVRVLSNDRVSAGIRELEAGDGLASGIYLYRVESVENVRTGRVAIIH